MSKETVREAAETFIKSTTPQIACLMEAALVAFDQRKIAIVEAYRMEFEKAVKTTPASSPFKAIWTEAMDRTTAMLDDLLGK